MNIESVLKNCDCLDLNLHQGIYWLDPKNNIVNYPFDGSTYGWLLVFRSIRIAFRYSDGLMYGNMYANNTWTGWLYFNSNSNLVNHHHDGRYLELKHMQYVVCNFVNGRATIPFDQLGRTTTPQVVVLTPVRSSSTSGYTDLTLQYSLEESSNEIVIYCYSNGGLFQSYLGVNIITN